MEFFSYLFKVNVAIAIFYIMYKLFYGNDTFFTIRRYLMLSMVVLSVLYPFLDFSQWIVQSQTLSEMTTSYVHILPAITVSPSDYATVSSEGNSFSTITLLSWIYLFIAGAFLLRLLFHISMIIWIRLYSQTVFIEGKRVFSSRKNTPSFSFFKWIFINPEKYDNKNLYEVLAHESIHVRQHHSIDVLISECFCAFCWINPMAWGLRKEIKLNLEFIVDQNVVKMNNIDRKSYQYHLLKFTSLAFKNSVSNQFNVSLIKERIMMLNVKKSPKVKLIAYTLVIPLALLFLVVNNVGAVVNKMNEKESVRNVVEKVSGMLTLVEEQYEDSPSAEPFKDATITTSDKKQNKNNDQKRLVGNVIDKDTRQPIEGVSIVIKGSSQGTITDKEGYFSIIVNEGDLLQLSFVGYATVALEASGTPKDAGTFEMSRKSVNLNSVQVVTYRPENNDSSDDNAHSPFVEKMPQFTGGEKALMKYIADAINYPTVAVQNNIQGEVLCKFVVKEDGRVGNVTIEKGVDPDLDDEAIRVLYSLPKWIPGEQGGKRVAVEYKIPVNFELKN